MTLVLQTPRLLFAFRKKTRFSGFVARGYHETITAAYVTLLAQFLAGRREDETLDVCVTRLLEGPLAARDALMAFYSRDRLISTEARAAWVEPDLARLDLAAVLDVRV